MTRRVLIGRKLEQSRPAWPGWSGQAGLASLLTGLASPGPAGLSLKTPLALQGPVGPGVHLYPVPMG